MKYLPSFRITSTRCSFTFLEKIKTLLSPLSSYVAIPYEWKEDEEPVYDIHLNRIDYEIVVVSDEYVQALERKKNWTRNKTAKATLFIQIGNISTTYVPGPVEVENFFHIYANSEQEVCASLPQSLADMIQQCDICGGFCTIPYDKYFDKNGETICRVCSECLKKTELVQYHTSGVLTTELWILFRERSIPDDCLPEIARAMMQDFHEVSSLIDRSFRENTFFQTKTLNLHEEDDDFIVSGDFLYEIAEINGSVFLSISHRTTRHWVKIFYDLKSPKKEARLDSIFCTKDMIKDALENILLEGRK